LHDFDPIYPLREPEEVVTRQTEFSVGFDGCPSQKLHPAIIPADRTHV
jgi:hypothetical protein